MFCFREHTGCAFGIWLKPRCLTTHTTFHWKKIKKIYWKRKFCLSTISFYLYGDYRGATSWRKRIEVNADGCWRGPSGVSRPKDLWESAHGDKMNFLRGVMGGQSAGPQPSGADTVSWTVWRRKSGLGLFLCMVSRRTFFPAKALLYRPTLYPWHTAWRFRCFCRALTEAWGWRYLRSNPFVLYLFLYNNM